MKIEGREVRCEGKGILNEVVIAKVGLVLHSREIKKKRHMLPSYKRDVSCLIGDIRTRTKAGLHSRRPTYGDTVSSWSVTHNNKGDNKT